MIWACINPDCRKTWLAQELGLKPNLPYDPQRPPRPLCKDCGFPCTRSALNADTIGVLTRLPDARGPE